MPKNWKKFILPGVALLVVLAGAWFWFLNASSAGIPAFYVWKLFSGEANGGERAAIDGIDLYYETYGERDAPPVLVLHGGLGFIESMHYQISALAPSHFVVAPDSRGHGRSTDGDGPITYEGMAADMVALMDKLGIEKADIVGWSDGGIIGLIMAMEHPERVRRLVTIGANYSIDGLSSLPPEDPSALNETLAPARKFYINVAPDPSHWSAFAGKVLHMWRTSPNYSPADLARIEAPVLVMAGENDSIKRTHTEELAQAIPDATLDIVPGASHFLPLEMSERANASILGFLEERAPSP